MNRMRQRKVRNDRALAIIRNLEEFQEDDAIKIADRHAKPAAKKVSFFLFLATTTISRDFCSHTITQYSLLFLNVRYVDCYGYMIPLAQEHSFILLYKRNDEEKIENDEFRDERSLSKSFKLKSMK